jgi:hypothetical protein
MKKAHSLALLFSASLVGVAAAGHLSPADDQNWPQWRGPDGNGVSRSKNLPVSWGVDKNIAWKTELPSWSGSTPIIWGDRIFVTSPSKSAESGAAAPAAVQVGFPPPATTTQRRGGPGQGRDAGGQTLLLLCLRKSDGSILWQRDLDKGNRIWMKQNATSPSPVTDGKRVCVVTGNGAVAAFDLEGKPIWSKNLQKEYGNFGLNWGYASSPILYNGKLIIEVLQGFNTKDPSYLVALDEATGKEVWKEIRPTDAPRESPDAYTTPALLTVAGRAQVVVSGGDYVTGHDPETGKEIWRAGGLNPNKNPNFRIVGSPVVADGMIYAPSRNRPLIALKAGGAGDVTATNTVWKFEDPGGPDVPTPVTDGKYFYIVNDRGMVICLEAKTGKLIYGPERTANGTVDSSPILADGKIYITNESAVTTVISAGPEFKVLATNELDGSFTMSSIAVSANQLFIRTGTHLYCIGEKAAR